MPNQNQVPGKIPALRTYAQDLEDTRNSKNLSPKVVAIDEPQAPTKIVAHKVAPIISSKSTASTPTIKRAPEKGLIDVTKELNDLGTKIIVDNEDAASATIITDTKHDRFKLFPAILSSLNNWFSNQKTERRKKAIPKYTIPQTTRRQGLIQKATSNTGKTATGDFRDLQERIKQRSDEVVEIETEGKTIWTPDTEPGYLLLPETNASPITNVIVEPRKSFYTEIALREEEEREDLETDEETSVWENPEMDDVQIEEPETETSVPAWEPKEIIPETPILEVVPPTIPVAPPQVKEIPLPVAEPKTRLIPPKPNHSANHSFWRQLHDLNTNTLALIISAFVLLIVASVIVIQIYLNQEKTTVTNLPLAPESLLLNTNLNLITNSTNAGPDLITALNNLKPTGQELIQAAFIEAASNNNPMAPVTVLNLLGLDLEKNLAQSISELRFGYTSEQQPFILMKVPNTIVAQGGLLLWEKNLYTDLAKIFVLDPIPQSSNLNFSDSTFAGRDVRLIKQPSGSEILIYGLINNTVIITTTSSSYRELSILIK